ncbi:MAG: hypothetical protein Tsb0020_09350 [Haliangiales bacterium]
MQLGVQALGGNATRVYSRVKVYVDKLARFTGTNWAKVNIDGSLIQQRVLKLAVPSAGSSAQQQALQRAVAYAREIGVQLDIVVFP